MNLSVRQMFSAMCLSAVAVCMAATDPYEGEYARPSWRLTPKAKAFVAECAKSAVAYRPRSERAHLFCRTQLKYGNERNDYLHNWYERPLYQDSTFASKTRGNELVNEMSWRRQVAGMRLTKLDGFAAYLSTTRRIEILERSRLKGAEALVLAELCSVDKAKGIGYCVNLAKRLLPEPQVFRIDGKVVISGAPTVRTDDEAGVGFWRDLRIALDKEFGPGRFIVMPYMHFIDGGDLDGREMPKEALVRWRDNIRSLLRDTDGGMYFLSAVFWGRRYNPKFHDNVIVPILHSVFAEPEFKDKRLGMALTQGHENCYRWTYAIDSAGTRTLRDSLASAALVRPDLLMFCEWDEENENTHFRPLTSNGHVTQRIVRHWADRCAGRPMDVFPGDDTSVPNIVVSYRKSLMAGEPIEVEVLNIPDGSVQASDMTVSFRWRDADGKIVKEWQGQPLNPREMSAAWFKCPASELVEPRVLFPELCVAINGSVRTFGRGMWPLNVEANRNLDFKWVKNALREIPGDVSGGLVVGDRLADGSYEVKCRVKGGARFRSIEVLENFDTAYMYDSARPEGWKGKVRLRVSCEGLSSLQSLAKLNGVLSLSGSGDARFLPRSGGTAAVVVSERKITFRDLRLNAWRHTFEVEMPESAVRDVFVDVDIKGVMKERIRVSDVVENESITLAGPYGKMFVFERLRAPLSIPVPCNVREAEFSFNFKPASPLSLLRLRTIDENYRIWHAQSVPQFVKMAGEKVQFHVCERTSDGTVREIALDRSRMVSLDYVFDKSRGDVLYSPGFNDMPIVLGGNVSLVTGVGRGESGYGCALAWASRKLASYGEARQMSPRMTAEGSLVFDGCAFASMPHQVLPIHAGFELEIRIKPARQERKVSVFDSGPLGVSLTLKEGVPEAFFSLGGRMVEQGRNRAEGDSVTGPALRLGEWNILKLVFDQNVAYLEVNGKKGHVKPMNGWRFNPRIGGLGTFVEGGAPSSPEGFFHGEIASFKVTPL